jgi:hypothetical protein
MSNETNFFGDYYNSLNTKHLPSTRYENIFKIGYDDKYPFFNIFKTITLPNDIDDSFFTYVKPLPTDTWTNLSYIYYGNIDLWWLIAITNDIFNPFIMPNYLKILKPEYIDLVIDNIQSQLK